MTMPKTHIFRIEDAGAKCLACNWEQDALYVEARDDTTAYAFYQQNGGICC